MLKAPPLIPKESVVYFSSSLKKRLGGSKGWVNPSETYQKKSQDLHRCKTSPACRWPARGPHPPPARPGGPNQPPWTEPVFGTTLSEGHLPDADSTKGGLKKSQRFPCQTTHRQRRVLQLLVCAAMRQSPGLMVWRKPGWESNKSPRPLHHQCPMHRWCWWQTRGSLRLF